MSQCWRFLCLPWWYESGVRPDFSFALWMESFKGMWHTEYLHVWPTSSFRPYESKIADLPSSFMVYLFYKRHLLLFNNQVIFQEYNLQYSAFFIEIRHFSDNALLNSSWRISSHVCKKRRGEKNFAELSSFWVLGPKRENSTMQNLHVATWWWGKKPWGSNSSETKRQTALARANTMWGNI